MLLPSEYIPEGGKHLIYGTIANINQKCASRTQTKRGYRRLKSHFMLLAKNTACFFSGYYVVLVRARRSNCE